MAQTHQTYVPLTPGTVPSEPLWTPWEEICHFSRVQGLNPNFHYGNGHVHNCVTWIYFIGENYIFSSQIYMLRLHFSALRCKFCKINTSNLSKQSLCFCRKSGDDWFSLPVSHHMPRVLLNTSWSNYSFLLALLKYFKRHFRIKMHIHMHTLSKNYIQLPGCQVEGCAVMHYWAKSFKNSPGFWSWDSLQVLRLIKADQNFCTSALQLTDYVKVKFRRFEMSLPALSFSGNTIFPLTIMKQFVLTYLWLPATENPGKPALKKRCLQPEL